MCQNKDTIKISKACPSDGGMDYSICCCSNCGKVWVGISIKV